MPDHAIHEVALAVDLGGTRFRVGVVLADGRVLRRASYLSQAEQGPERVISRIVEAIGKLRAGLPARRQAIRGVGVAAPGPLDPWEGVVFTAPNMPGWRDVPLKAKLQDALGLSVLVGNDANLAALGESRYGAGRGHRHLVYLTVSTGVGSGVLVDGQLLLGRHGLATEAGHTIIRMDGPQCGCGARGCLEAFASGTAIARRANDLLSAGRASSLAARGHQVTAEMVDEAAEAGDLMAQEVVREAASALGVGVVNLVHLFNPSIVVLGGGVSRSGNLWWTEVRRSVDECGMRQFVRDLPVVPAGLKDDAGLVGGGAAVWDHVASQD